MLASCCRAIRFALLVCLVAGCAASTGNNAGYLLGQDPLRMSNPELTAYEQALSEEIASASAGGAGGTSVGFGVGSWGGDTGFGVGVSQILGGGGDGDAVVALRDRREAVRVEMRRRGLLPPAAGGH